MIIITFIIKQRFLIIIIVIFGILANISRDRLLFQLLLIELDILDVSQKSSLSLDSSCVEETPYQIGLVIFNQFGEIDLFRLCTNLAKSINPHSVLYILG